jgi:Fe-S cluster assembly protein SufD
MSDHPFTPALAERLGGPDALARHRLASAARVEVEPLPTTDLEEWRYSRVDEIDLASHHPADEPETAALPAGLLADRDEIASRAATVLVRNGRVVAIDVDDELVAKGVRIGRLAELPELVDGYGETVGEGEAFVAMSGAFAPDPLVVDVPRGVVVPTPIVVAQWIDDDGVAAFPRVLVRTGEASQATVVEWSGSDDVAALTVPVVELDLGRASRLSFVSVQQLGPRMTQIGRHASRVGQEATLSMAHAALGGDFARLRFDCRLEGRGATGDLAALYFGDGEHLHDLRTFQVHQAPDTTSDLLFKGAVDDASHAVYTGLIRITKDGRGSNATQSNRIVKLSPEAWAESVPNLEIEHNDVRCAHASAVGPIDPEQRFYLESRGVTPDAAERLVVKGFFAEVLERIPVPEVAARLERTVATKLGAAR